VRFYLGTHLPSWLGSVPVPLFVSHRRLARSARLPVARTRWALDSGGFSELAGYGFALHGFGIKTRGLGRYAALLASADSMAWSYNARRHTALPGCPHRNCANCPRWALRWRERVLAQAAVQQLAFRLVPATRAAA
jgi:hypothetical protein